MNPVGLIIATKADGYRIAGSHERTRESTSAEHFIKNPAFSTAKMAVDERGRIVFDCQIIVFGR